MYFSYIQKYKAYFLAGAILILLFFLVRFEKSTQVEEVRLLAQKPPTVEALLAQSLASTTLEAHAIFVWDSRDKKVLYAENAEQQLPLASLTKLMTAFIVREKLEPFTVVRIPTDLPVSTASKLRPGDRWRLSELLDYTLITSSNEGARSLAEVIGALDHDTVGGSTARHDFVDMMNTRARTLGLTQTYFINESGLDLSEPGFVSGAYGSAKDVVRLIEVIGQTYPELLEATSKKTTQLSSQTQKYTAQNTNATVENIPGIFASKTGLTDLSGGNLAVAFDAGLNHPVIIVVLGSSTDGRFSDVATLAKATIKAVGSYR